MTPLRDFTTDLRARLAAMLTRGALTPEVARDVQAYVQRRETIAATGTDPGPGVGR